MYVSLCGIVHVSSFVGQREGRCYRSRGINGHGTQPASGAVYALYPVSASLLPDTYRRYQLKETLVLINNRRSN